MFLKTLAHHLVSSFSYTFMMVYDLKRGTTTQLWLILYTQDIKVNENFKGLVLLKNQIDLIKK